MAFFIDASVFIYAAGKEHPYKEPCSEILKLIELHSIQSVISVEVIQEILHRSIRIGQKEDGIKSSRIAFAIMPVEPLDAGDCVRALELLELYSVDCRDAFHAAWMLRRGITSIISADKHFDRIKGIERIDPIEFIASRF